MTNYPAPASAEEAAAYYAEEDRAYRAYVAARYRAEGASADEAEAKADAEIAAEAAYYAERAHECPREAFLEDPITVAYGVGGMVSLIDCPVCDAEEAGR